MLLAPPEVHVAFRSNDESKPADKDEEGCAERAAPVQLTGARTLGEMFKRHLARIRPLQSYVLGDTHNVDRQDEGNEGGEAVLLANQSIIVPSSSVARIQEMHILIIHILCEILERDLNLV